MTGNDDLKNKVRINPRDLQDIACQQCGNQTFVSAFVLKRISPIVSPTGKEEILPIPVFTCNACGAVPSRFLEGIPFEYTKTDTMESPSANPDNAPVSDTPASGPSKSGLTLLP